MALSTSSEGRLTMYVLLTFVSLLGTYLSIPLGSAVAACLDLPVPPFSLGSKVWKKKMRVNLLIWAAVMLTSLALLMLSIVFGLYCTEHVGSGYTKVFFRALYGALLVCCFFGSIRSSAWLYERIE